LNKIARHLKNSKENRTKANPPESAGTVMNTSKESRPWLQSLKYKCHFCRKVLVKVPLSGLWYLLLLLGFRSYYCPHCFGARIRPCGWLRLLLAPFWAIFNLLRRQ
jgi:hypothetical protein